MANQQKTEADQGRRGFQFLEWLPWEKLTIWAIFLLLVYSLRSFFFIIFMTFIIAYSMRGLVDWLANKISPDAEKAWLHRLLTVGCFLGLQDICVTPSRAWLGQASSQQHEKY